MTGWIMIFAAALAITGALGGSARTPAVIFASALFALLFILALCTRAIRGIIC